jgi:hypothetical protein
MKGREVLDPKNFMARISPGSVILFILDSSFGVVYDHVIYRNARRSHSKG